MRALIVALLCVSTPALADEPLYACKEQPATAKLSASFKPDVAIKDLILWAMAFQCKNVIAAPEVNLGTTLNVIAPKSMTPKQALQLFVDAIESAGYVVQQKADTIVIKGGPNTPKCPAATIPSASSLADAPDPVGDEFRAGLAKIDEQTFEVTRKAFDLLTRDDTLVTRGARIVPGVTDGKPDGVKLYAIRPSSAIAALGLTNGDTIKSIDGVVIVGTESFASAAAQARKRVAVAKGRVTFKVQVVRRGKPVEITYVVK